MNNFQCWICDKTLDTPDEAFAHLDKEHGGVIPAMADRIETLVKIQDRLAVESNKLREENVRLAKMLTDRMLAKLDGAFETITNVKDEREAYHKELQIENARLREEKVAAEKAALDSLLLAQELINTLAKATGMENDMVMARILDGVNKKMKKAIDSFATEQKKEPESK